MCGLAQESRLTQASYAIALPYYLWFVLFLGVGLLSLPLAKLWLLGPKTSFTRFDVTTLATSTALLTLLGPVVILAFVAHNRLDERAERQVAHVATDLEQRLRRQLSTAAERLDAFNADAQGRKLHFQLLDRRSNQELLTQRAECTQAGGTLARSIFFAEKKRGKSVCERTFYPLPVAKKASTLGVAKATETTPDWKLVFLSDTEGDERVKLVPDGQDSTAVSVKDRGYFRRALRGSTACLNASCKIRGATELVRSITSGLLVLVVAQPVCEDSYPCRASADEEPKAIGVAALQTEMMAFRSLVLPLGMQAAVVDESGHIMLHSNNDAHHEQNLFGEVDQPNELRASLLANVPDTLRLNYLGQLSRLHIEPLRLPGSGWSVITIAPTSIVDVCTTDMVLATLFGYGMLVLLVLLVLCCGLTGWQVIKWVGCKNPTGQVGEKTIGLGLRPHAQRSEAYAVLGLWTLLSGAALCIVAMFTTPFLPTTAGLLVALSLCLVASKKLLRISKCTPLTVSHANASPSRTGTRPWREFLPLTYTLCIAGLAEVFIMAPATVLFNGAYSHVIDNLVRPEQQQLGAALNSHQGCLQVLPPSEPRCRNC